MELNITGINFLGVLLTGGIVFVIGGVWYQALFGKKWAALHNYSDEDLKRMQQRIPPMVFFPVILGAYLVMSLAMAMLMTALDISSIANGVIFGGLIWVIVAAIGVTAHITSDKHIGIYAIDTAYQLVIFLVAGGMLAVWR